MPKLSWSRKRCPYCGGFVREDAKYCTKCNKPLVVLGNIDINQVYDNLLIDKSRESVQNWLKLHQAFSKKAFKDKFFKVKDEIENPDIRDQLILADQDEYDDISGTVEEVIVEPQPISLQNFSNAVQQLSQLSENISSLLSKAKEIGAFKMLAYLGVISNAARLMIPTLSMNTPEGSGRPEAVVGGVPIYNIQRKERARSDRKVKYRAIGDVFLAHQKGTKDSLRIDGFLDGPLRYLYLWALLSLQQKGETQVDKITPEKLGLTFDPSKIPQDYLEQVKEIGHKKEINYEFHHTFPIITRFSILFDMFLQTIEWHKTLRSGKQTIEYHLLFRKWVPNTGYKVFNPKFDDDGNIQGEINIHLLTENRYKWTKFLIDAIWKGVWMVGEVCPRLIFGITDDNIRDLDRSGFTQIDKLVQSYNATKYLGKKFFETIKFVPFK